MERDEAPKLVAIGGGTEATRCPLCGGHLHFHYLPGDRDSLIVRCLGHGLTCTHYRLAAPPVWAAECRDVTTE